MRKITVDKKNQKTYVSDKNLEKALNKLNLPETVTYLETWTECGRVTAVFTNIHSYKDNFNSIFISFIVHAGFKIVG